MKNLDNLGIKYSGIKDITESTILEKDGKTCGNIVSVNDQTAQHYFILDLVQKEVIIPIVKEWILEVNRDEKFIKMELPEGLIDVFLN